MVLTIRKNSHFLEDVFIELVGVKFTSIQNSSATGCSSCICTCRLLHLKLFDQIVDFFLGRLLEVIVLLHVISFRIIVTTIFLSFCTTFLIVTPDFLTRNDKTVQPDFRNLNVDGVTIGISTESFKFLLQVLISETFLKGVTTRHTSTRAIFRTFILTFTHFRLNVVTINGRTFTTRTFSLHVKPITCRDFFFFFLLLLNKCIDLFCSQTCIRKGFQLRNHVH